MGTDIHAVFQKRLPDGRWEHVHSEYGEDRDYQLFAALAGVRNGCLCATVTPISEPRGLPRDFSGGSLGDYGYSWLLGSEVLAWAKNAPTVTQWGIVSREVYERWDKVSPPCDYSDALWGGSVIVATEENASSKPGWTDIEVSWQVSLREQLAYFIDEVQRLVDLHGEIRMVFGFDS